MARFNTKKNEQGFTLLETLLYVALLSFFLSSLVGITYQSLQSTDKISKQISLQQEANFLIRKMDWALTGASSVNIVSPTQIYITRYVAPLTVDFQYNATDKTLEVYPSDQTQFYALNSSNVTVDSAAFSVTPVGTANYADVSLMLNGQTFALKKFLR